MNERVIAVVTCSFEVHFYEKNQFDYKIQLETEEDSKLIDIEICQYQNLFCLAFSSGKLELYKLEKWSLKMQPISKVTIENTKSEIKIIPNSENRPFIILTNSCKLDYLHFSTSFFQKSCIN